MALNNELRNGFKRFSVDNVDYDKLVVTFSAPVDFYSSPGCNIVLDCRLPAFYPHHPPEFFITNLKQLPFSSKKVFVSPKGRFSLENGSVIVPIIETARWTPSCSMFECLTSIVDFLLSIDSDSTPCIRPLSPRSDSDQYRKRLRLNLWESTSVGSPVETVDMQSTIAGYEDRSPMCIPVGFLDAMYDDVSKGSEERRIISGKQLVFKRMPLR